MQSPLQHLLDQVAARCDLAQCTSISGAAAEAGEQTLRAPGFSDVAAVLLAVNVQGCAADGDHVASCKQRGTAAFGRGQHRQAAQLFSEALRYCDEAGGGEAGAPLAARLYCNRSLCLSKLHPPQLEAALADAAAATAADPSFAKGWYRRAATLQALGRGSPAALADARRALQLLQLQGGPTGEAAALVAQLEAELAEGTDTGDVSPAAATDAGSQSPPAAATDGEEGAGPAATGAPAANGHATPDEVAAAAAAGSGSSEPAAQQLLNVAAPLLAVQQAAEAGRGLAAAQPLRAGTDVLRDRPFVHALTKKGRRSACATCLAPLGAAVAPFYCRRCPLPAYCSPACRAADAFHPGAECGRPWSVLLPPDALCALRAARKLAAPASGGGAAAAEQVRGLLTHFELLRPAEAAELAALAAVTHAVWRSAAAECAADGGGGGRGPAGEAEGGVAAADVLRELCRLQVNGLAVVPPRLLGADDRLALALYPAAALFNHSCRPNVAARFEGGTLIVRTIEAVPAGAPLLHCYGPQEGDATAAQRRLMLQRQYGFTCRCTACAAADTPEGRLADLAPAGLRCAAGGRCEGAVLPVSAVPAGVLHRHQLPAGSGSCCLCGERLDAERWQGRMLPELQAASEAHAAAEARLQEAERGGGGSDAAAAAAAREAVRGLRQCLRLRQAHLHPGSALLGATHDALAHAWHAAGNGEAAAQHLRHSLASMQHAYPPHSTAVAFQRRQLASALRLGAAAAVGGGGAAAAEALLAEARQAEEGAAAVLALHFADQEA